MRDAGRPEDAERLKLYEASIIPPLRRFVAADLPQLAGTLREKTGRKQFHYDLNDPLQEKVNDVLQRRI